jgi:hypothetical protein
MLVTGANSGRDTLEDERTRQRSRRLLLCVRTLIRSDEGFLYFGFWICDFGLVESINRQNVLQHPDPKILPATILNGMRMMETAVIVQFSNPKSKIGNPKSGVRHV